MSIDRSFDSIVPGESAAFTHRIESAQVDTFAQVSGDHNPLHMDEKYASDTTFGRRVVHGMLLGGLTSRLVGMYLPGRTALLVKHELEFRKPVFIGDEVLVRGTVHNKSEALRLIELELAILRGEDLVATGRAHVRMLA
jgi:acyl dehydratase